MAYVIWSFVFLIGAGLLFSSASADKYFTFEIQPNAVTSSGVQFGGNIELPNVLCFIKVTTEGLDKDGKVILTKQSQFFKKSPSTTYSLVDGQTKSEITSFKVTPKIRCDKVGEPASLAFVPMILKSAELKAYVMAKQANTDVAKKEVWNNIKTAKDIPIQNGQEKEITSYTVNTVDLFKYMEKGSYEAELTFQVTGTLNFVYEKYPAPVYSITVPRESVQTWVYAQVTKDQEPQTPVDNPKPEEGTKETDPKTPTDGIKPITDDLLKLSICLTTADVPCLTQQNYIPYFIGGLGFVVLIGAMTTRNHPVFDQFGNRIR